MNSIMVIESEHWTQHPGFDCWSKTSGWWLKEQVYNVVFTSQFNFATSTKSRTCPEVSVTLASLFRLFIEDIWLLVKRAGIQCSVRFSIQFCHVYKMFVTLASLFWLFIEDICLVVKRASIQCSVHFSIQFCHVYKIQNMFWSFCL